MRVSARNMDACPICMREVQESGLGENYAFSPPCCSNACHLGCVSRYLANACNHNCPMCRSSAFVGDGYAYAQICREQGMAPIGEREEIRATDERTVADYMPRTFTRHDAEEPPPPAGLQVTCCFREHRNSNQSDWQPLPVRGQNAECIDCIMSYRGHWSCPACGEGILQDDLDLPGNAHMCHICNQPQTINYDMTSRRISTICQNGCHLLNEDTSIINNRQNNNNSPDLGHNELPQPSVDNSGSARHDIQQAQVRNNKSQWRQMLVPNNQFSRSQILKFLCL